jgi:hypothetical protein
MELEQLVGSNSFGAAIKQPFFLRRIDLLTLLLFVVWCLSPLGSQGLQRAWTTQIPLSVTTTESVYFIDTTSPNPLFGPNGAAAGNPANGELSTTAAESLQLASVFYMAAFYHYLIQILNNRQN